MESKGVAGLEQSYSQAWFKCSPWGSLSVSVSASTLRRVNPLDKQGICDRSRLTSQHSATQRGEPTCRDSSGRKCLERSLLGPLPGHMLISDPITVISQTRCKPTPVAKVGARSCRHSTLRGFLRRKWGSAVASTAP